MSRYTIPARPETLTTYPGATVTVGWDNPLQTFFGHVMAPVRDEGDEPVVWIGTEEGEITHALDLSAQMWPWACIPGEVLVQLARDYAAREPQTALQRAILDLF